MAYPGARLLALSRYGLDPVTIQQTRHFRIMREFYLDPHSLHGDDDGK